LLYFSDFLVLLDVQKSYQERQKCNGVISVCLQNTDNRSQLYISNKSNDTTVKSQRRKATSRIHKKNRRKHFQRKIHRHSTRVLSLKPASILLPPYENDFQDRNVSTLNPFIINVLANSRTSSSVKKLEFFPVLSDQESNHSNKPFLNTISTPELESNSTSVQNSKITTTTEHFKTPIIVPPSGPISSNLENEPTPANFEHSDAEVRRVRPTQVKTTNLPPPPNLFLLPPFLEFENNVIDTQILENPNDLQLPSRSTDYFETSSSFSNNRQIATESSSTTLSVEEAVNKEPNPTPPYDSHIPKIKTSDQSISDDLNKTKEIEEGNSYGNFNNTLLAPEVASLGMKILTSKKGLEMVKELATTNEPKSKNQQQYDDSQSLLETAESGDIRLHTYNQIVNIEEVKDVSKNMYKALKKPQRNFQLCGSNQGYVADISSGCQVFYICLGSGAGEPMMCPNGTLFNQEVLVCDWWYNVECSG
ncbi:unnamed protein product, partial [Nezara viridula]